MEFQARVIYDYKAVEDSELSVSTGDVVIIREVSDAGWCLAEINNSCGWIPADYIENIEVPDDDIQIDEAQPEVEIVSNENDVDQEVVDININDNDNNVDNNNVDNNNNNNNVDINNNNIDNNKDDGKYNDEKQEPNLPTKPKELKQVKKVEDTPKKSGFSEKDLTQQQMDDIIETLKAQGQEIKYCGSCKGPIIGDVVFFQDVTYHPDHFRCTVCDTTLGGKQCKDHDGLIHCLECYLSNYGQKCGKCGDVLRGQYLTALDKTWHKDCFVCTVCDQPFKTGAFYKHNGEPYCKDDYAKLFGATCSKCDKKIASIAYQAMDKKFHLECFTCCVGDHQIGDKEGSEAQFRIHDERIYCTKHFEEMFKTTCDGCNKDIEGQYMFIAGKHYHSDCWKCKTCDKVLTHKNNDQYKMEFYCKPCCAKVKEEAGAMSFAPPPKKKAPKKGPVKKESAPVKNEPVKKQPVKKQPVKAQPVKKQPVETQPKKHVPLQNKAVQGDNEDIKTEYPVEADSALLRLIAKDKRKKVKVTFIQEQEKYTYKALLNAKQLPPSVDISRRENYLSDADFVKLFACSREEFAKMKPWKQAKKKKAVGLF